MAHLLVDAADSPCHEMAGNVNHFLAAGIGSGAEKSGVSILGCGAVDSSVHKGRYVELFTDPEASMDELVVVPASKPALTISEQLPTVLQYAGIDVIKAFATFFTDQIRNPNTREAYLRNATGFFEWCSLRSLAFADIESFHVSAYVEHLRLSKSDATVKQHLASLKMLFDWMVVQQIVSRNPAAAVRGPKLVQRKGKTPVMDEEGARHFFESFAVRAEEKGRPLNVIELRDRAFCAVMTYAMPRVSSVCGMRVGDYYQNGKSCWLRFSAKGGKFQEMPAHRKLVDYLDAYLAAGGIGDQKKSPLFRSTRGTSKRLNERAMCRKSAWSMVQRRAKDASIQMDICNHTFRGTGITNYMKNGGQLKHAQDMAGHADPRTTRLYDHSGNQVSFDEVERIHI